jgi:hypothetical protein
VLVDYPHIANLGDRRVSREFGNLVGPIVLIVRQARLLDAEIDFAYIKPGDLKTEVEIQRGEFSKLGREWSVVPLRYFGQAIVGDHKGPGLSFAQMMQLDRWHFAPLQLPSGQQTPVPCDHFAGCIN